MCEMTVDFMLTLTWLSSSPTNAASGRSATPAPGRMLPASRLELRVCFQTESDLLRT